MRGLRSMTQEEREFAEQHHNMVIDYLRCKHLPMDDFYDIVIFGYPSAVQQYFRNPPANVEFKAMAFRAMKDSVLRESEYHARAKRCGITVGLDDAELTDHRQDTEQQIEGKVLLEQAAGAATPKEAKILRFLLDGFALHEAARLLKIPRAAAESCMEGFCCRARAAIG